MAIKIDIIDQIGSTKSFADKCDPMAVKRLVTHMVTIENSFEDNEINRDDRLELRRSARNISESFANNCKCLKM